VPWLRRLVTGLSRRRLGIDPRPVHVGFVVDKVALGRISSQSTSVFPSVSFHQCSITHNSFTYHWRYIILVNDSIVELNKIHGVNGKQNCHCIASNIQQLQDVLWAALLQQCQPQGSSPSDVRWACDTLFAAFQSVQQHQVRGSTPESYSGGLGESRPRHMLQYELQFPCYFSITQWKRWNNIRTLK
jgi:hypothetical protein